MKKERASDRYNSFVMSLLVAEYRKTVTNHAPLHKRAEAAKEARNFYKNCKEIREICTKPIERGWYY